MVENWTNNDYANIIDVIDEPVGHYGPGSDEFAREFNRITSAKNNEEEGGTRFFDRSALTHAHGEYSLDPSFVDEIKVGANVRRYGYSEQ